MDFQPRILTWLTEARRLVTQWDRTFVYTPWPEKKTCNLPWITLTNLNVFLLFLAHIIPMIAFTKNVKFAEIRLDLLTLFTEEYRSIFFRTCCRWFISRGVATGVGISVYIPPNQSTLNFFMWLFCLLDPFIPTQIKFLATPLFISYISASGWIGTTIS